MAMNGYIPFPKAPGVEPLHPMVCTHIQHTRCRMVLPLWKDAIGV